MSEPMIPKSMHDAAVEAATTFATQKAERRFMGVAAALVEAAGGEVRVPRRLFVDPPELYVSEDVADPFSNIQVFKSHRQETHR